MSGQRSNVPDEKRRELELQRFSALPKGRMDEHHRFATVEFCEQGIKGRVAEIPALVAGKQHDPIKVQGVQCILQFQQGSIGVRKGEGRKRSEPPGSIGDQACCELVAPTCKITCQEVVAEEDARVRNGGDRGGDAITIHECQGACRVPGWKRESSRHPDAVSGYS